MVVYPHYLHYMFGFLSHPLGVFFAGFLVAIVTIVSKVRLRPEFKEMWALMKGLTESGETLLLGWWRFRRKNCRAPLPPKKVTNADKQGLALCNMKVYHGFGEELFVTRFCLQI